MITIGENQQIIIIPEQQCDKEPIYLYTEEPQELQRFNSYSEFKRHLNEYEGQTITKFILRNQSKQFTAPGIMYQA